ncbi:methylenetetrahydrofolate reductase [Halorubrum sp. Ib24]|uniref:methylenetetrahydrofolate reductase n=1 Tax=unclassified Halorubrum TaxID=2642239 RepID=UPI000B981672|nr:MULTISPECIES: methylenetetrahydrofolate reductase [unclassified Halorubrum]OYR47262.1 methylenetetrahydrofolate reductase [Halorubrum sp. Eb13]OYR42966.1 methylenetetrahydrofolate reductase [Halorubrum sp. Ib24]OYR43527.1 methylenetetrahydrofolate reductase [Halorubrum sp. Hd13]OYR44895.1 methylenetetrahydrofolate reductase [Halorubrum sp. Ea8]OYR55071.1 methylenetetrahydrofolate reductase [Halorubrum sp. Ea1]
MSAGTQAIKRSDGVGALLTDARFELMPFESFEDEIRHLPDDATIAVTTSPQLGIDTTVERTEQAAALGYDVSPHIAARYVEDRDHLDEIAERLTDAGVTDIFVPGGDREEPAGEFESAHDLLVALDELGHSFDEVGITGYPEGHDFLDAEALSDAMAKKSPYATYLVTQLCYDPDAVLEWIDDIRDDGVDLPVEVGIPGVMNYQRLMQISQKVGVGDSIKFLRKTTGILGFVRQLVGSRGVYKPDDLIDGLAPYADDDHYKIRGIHIYTFNQTPDTESWRTERLGR